MGTTSFFAVCSSAALKNPLSESPPLLPRLPAPQLRSRQCDPFSTFGREVRGLQVHPPKGLQRSAAGRLLDVHCPPPRRVGSTLGDPTVREALLGPGQGPHRGPQDIPLKENLRSWGQWRVCSSQCAGHAPDWLFLRKVLQIRGALSSGRATGHPHLLGSVQLLTCTRCCQGAESS